MLESSKWNTLFLCMFTLLSIAFTALCKALCLLWCKKLDIPSYAKPIKPVIRDDIIPLLLFFAFWESLQYYVNFIFHDSVGCPIVLSYLFLIKVNIRYYCITRTKFQVLYYRIILFRGQAFAAYRSGSSGPTENVFTYEIIIKNILYNIINYDGKYEVQMLFTS